MKRLMGGSLLVGLAIVATGCGAKDDGAGPASESDLIESTSAYTSTDKAQCTRVEGEYDGWRCNGMAGNDLFITESEGRASLLRVNTHGEPKSLGIDKLPFFGGASHFGPNAEWRGRGLAIGQVDPYALIVRYFVKGADGQERNYMVVSRLEEFTTCVVGTVDGATPNHNEKAREIADANKETKCPDPCGKLSSGRTLNAGDSISSCNKAYALSMQPDGNLVLYDTARNAALWNSHTNGKGGEAAIMQEDGNFVLYSNAGKALWNSGTAGNPGAAVELTDEGALQVSSNDDAGFILWSAPR